MTGYRVICGVLYNFNGRWIVQKEKVYQTLKGATKFAENFLKP